MVLRQLDCNVSAGKGGDAERMASQSGIRLQKEVHLPMFSMLAHAEDMVPERGLESDRLGLKYSR